LTRLPELERRLSGISRQVTLHREAFQNLQTQLTQVRLAEAAKIGTARLVEPATVPLSPASPKKGLNMALALIAGFLLGALLGAWAEFSDPAFRSADDAADQLDLPLLGAVPPFSQPKPVRQIRQEGAVLLPSATSMAMARWQDPGDDSADAFRVLRTGLRNLKPPMSVLVISPGVGEGKTTVSLNLAIGLAQVGRKVLLVDADLRRPNLHRQLQLQATPGLTDLLLANPPDGTAFADLVLSCTQRIVSIPGLSVITGGSRTGQPGDLLESPRLSLLLAAQRNVYDVVIIDGPPALAYADAVTLGGFADGVIIVVDPRQTPRRAAQQVVAMLRQARIPILGLVANRTTSPDKSSYSRYETAADPTTGPAEVSR
jgi:succinoglycan biosynthesis transport protein ExoP